MKIHISNPISFLTVSPPPQKYPPYVSLQARESSAEGPNNNKNNNTKNPPPPLLTASVDRGRGTHTSLCANRPPSKARSMRAMIQPSIFPPHLQPLWSQAQDTKECPPASITTHWRAAPPPRKPPLTPYAGDRGGLFFARYVNPGYHLSSGLPAAQTWSLQARVNNNVRYVKV